MTPTFWRTDGFSDSSFIDLVNRTFYLSFTGVTEARAWIDNSGYWTSYPVTDGLIFNVDSDNIKSLKFPIRIYDYGVWISGQTGTIGDFTQYSTNNVRIVDNDPWGNSVVLWKSYSVSGNTSNGGIYMNPTPIDNTKTYRMSTWENRVSNSTTTMSNYYFGLNGYGTDNGVKSLTTETPNTNPYFWSTTYNGLTENQWFLIVGHIHPHNYTGTTSSDSGRYLANGTKLGNITSDFRWLSGTTTGRLRTLMVYTTVAQNTNDVVHHAGYTRFDLCDGTEPSLNDLLNNNTDKLYDLINPSTFGYLINGPKYVSGGLDFNGINESCTVDNNLSLVQLSALTLSVWFYSNSATGMSLLKSNGFLLHYRGDGFYLMADDGTTSGYLGYTVAPDSSKWIMITATWDGSTMKIYIDGIKQSSELSFSGGANNRIYNLTYLTVGGYFNSSQPWTNGKIGDYKIYNRALSANDISINYSSMKNRFQ